jgi:hypothetical protein
MMKDFTGGDTMKKVLCILAMVLVLAGVASAQGVIFSSGLTTADRLIATGNCKYYGMSIVSGASTAVVVIYDSLTISGTSIDKGACTISQASCLMTLPVGVNVFTGIYADVTGTGAAYTVFYKCD